MKYISLKQKTKGKISKNKEYKLEDFIKLISGFIPVETIKKNKPWYAPYDLWDYHAKYAFREGYKTAIREINSMMIYEIDADEMYNNKNRGKKK